MKKKEWRRACEKKRVSVECKRRAMTTVVRSRGDKKDAIKSGLLTKRKTKRQRESLV